MVSRIVWCFILGLIATPAVATPVQYGVGLSYRVGVFAGFSSSGASVDLRLGKVALQGTAMQGDQDLKEDLGDDLFVIFNTPKNYTIEKATIRQQGVGAQLKFHPMNGSFYFGFGGGRTVGTAKLEATGSGGEMLDERLVMTRDLQTLAIGNVWTPGGIMIGCEWGAVAGASNIKSEATSESNPGTNEDLADLKTKFERKVKDYSGSSTVHAMLVYLGFMLGA